MRQKICTFNELKHSSRFYVSTSLASHFRLAMRGYSVTSLPRVLHFALAQLLHSLGLCALYSHLRGSILGRFASVCFVLCNLTRILHLCLNRLEML